MSGSAFFCWITWVFWLTVLCTNIVWCSRYTGISMSEQSSLISSGDASVDTSASGHVKSWDDVTRESTTTNSPDTSSSPVAESGEYESTGVDSDVITFSAQGGPTVPVDADKTSPAVYSPSQGVTGHTTSYSEQPTTTYPRTTNYEEKDPATEGLTSALPNDTITSTWFGTDGETSTNIPQTDLSDHKQDGLTSTDKTNTDLSSQVTSTSYVNDNQTTTKDDEAFTTDVGSPVISTVSARGDQTSTVPEKSSESSTASVKVSQTSNDSVKAGQTSTVPPKPGTPTASVKVSQTSTVSVKAGQTSTVPERTGETSTDPLKVSQTSAETLSTKYESDKVPTDRNFTSSTYFPTTYSSSESSPVPKRTSFVSTPQSRIVSTLTTPQALSTTKTTRADTSVFPTSNTTVSAKSESLSTISTTHQPVTRTVTSPHTTISATPTPTPSSAPKTTTTPTPSSTPKTTTTPTPSSAPKTTTTPTPSSAPKTTTTPTPSSSPKTTTTPTPSTASKTTTTPTPSSAPKTTTTPTPSSSPKTTTTPTPSSASKTTTTPTPSSAPKTTYTTPTPSTASKTTTTPTPRSSPKTTYTTGASRGTPTRPRTTTLQSTASKPRVSVPQTPSLTTITRTTLTTSKTTPTLLCGPECAGEPEDQDSSLIMGLVVSAITILLLVALAFILFKVWKRKGRFKSRVKYTFAKEQSVSLNTLMASKPRCVKLQDFVNHVDDMHCNSNFGFSDEYKTINKMSPKHSTTGAEQETCRIKNRYTNVLAFDHSRVKLLPQDDDEGSDYINANYIPGYNSRREYVAAQGPLPCTKDDFWRMIWENKVTIVVMLTQCKERGRIKCEMYWPNTNEPVYFGDLIVQLRSESVLPDYVIRILDVRQGNIRRVVKHFHFLKWPDFGCPEKTSLLLNFVRAIRCHLSHPPEGPVLVHCSAGVGRTGTYIAVDYQLQHIKEHADIDIFKFVLDMRNHRPLMVQTENQYVYIHDCIRDALEEGAGEETTWTTTLSTCLNCSQSDKQTQIQIENESENSSQSGNGDQMQDGNENQNPNGNQDQNAKQNPNLNRNQIQNDTGNQINNRNFIQYLNENQMQIIPGNQNQIPTKNQFVMLDLNQYLDQNQIQGESVSQV